MKKSTRIAETAKTMGTEILDHIIIAGDNAFGFKGKGLI
jgi:DNA repair protein RadC